MPKFISQQLHHSPSMELWYRFRALSFLHGVYATPSSCLPTVAAVCTPSHLPYLVSTSSKRGCEAAAGDHVPPSSSLPVAVSPRLLEVFFSQSPRQGLACCGVKVN